MSVCVYVCCVCACSWRPVKGVRNWSYRGVSAAGCGAGSRTGVLCRSRDHSHPWALSPAQCCIVYHSRWWCKPGRAGPEDGANERTVSCWSQLFSEHQTVCTLVVKKGYLNKVLMSSSCLWSFTKTNCTWQNMFLPRGTRITAAKVNSLLSTTPGRSTATHSKNKSVFWRNWGPKTCVLPSTQKSRVAPFLDCVLTLNLSWGVCSCEETPWPQRVIKTTFHWGGFQFRV